MPKSNNKCITTTDGKFISPIEYQEATSNHLEKQGTLI